MENQIKEINYNEKLFKKLIKKALKKDPNQGYTIADIIVATGLSNDWVEYALPQLLKEYPCRLETNNENELVYVFDFDAGQNRVTRRLKQWLQKRNPQKKNIVRQLVAYIFGVTNELKDKWFTEKIVLHYLRSNGGKIVIAELVQLTGWSIRQAETEAVQLLANYNRNNFV